jgi:hypothetical protein
MIQGIQGRMKEFLTQNILLGLAALRGLGG